MTLAKINKELLKPRSEPNYVLVEDLVYYVHKNLCNHELPINLSFMYNFKNLRVKTYSWFAKFNNISIEEVILYTDSDSGCCYYNVDNNQYLILYNDLIINPYHNRWTLAHELGHFLLRHNEICDTAVLGRNTLGLEEYKVYEKEANAFARQLLVPLNVLCCISDREVTVSQIMEMCDLSYEAANNIISFANNGAQMGITYFCETRTTKIFDKFIKRQKYLKFCCNCNYSFTSLNAKFCPICGHNRLSKGDAKNKMNYICDYEIDDNSRLLKCPICHNEEITNGEYCKICGTYLINKCINYEEDSWGNQVSGCGKIAEANARYCIYCGSKTTFYKNGLLCDYKDYDSSKITTNLLWKDIVNELRNNGKIILHTNLINSSLEELKNFTYTITINNTSPFTCAILSKPDNIETLKEIFKNKIDKSINLNIYNEAEQKFIYTDNALPF